jgi:hypothetical protein
MHPGATRQLLNGNNIRYLVGRVINDQYWIVKYRLKIPQRRHLHILGLFTSWRTRLSPDVRA